MDDVPRINTRQAQEYLTQGSAIFVDIRDPRSIATSHIPGSQVLDNENIATFLAETDKKQPIVVYCYHGNNSKSVTAYLLKRGFQTVWSMDGGFEEWQKSYEVTR